MSATLPSLSKSTPLLHQARDGRAIMLERLLQSPAYGGLLLGLPGSKREAHPP